MSGLLPAGHVLDRSELPHDRCDGRERRNNPEDHQHPLVLVLRPRENARLAPRVHHHAQNQDEERPSSDVPGDQEARRFADLHPEAQSDIGRDHQDPSRQETRPMCKRAQKAGRGLAGWLSRTGRRRFCCSNRLVGSRRRRRLGRSGPLVGSWRGRRLGHAKAISGPEEACLARGDGEGQAALTAQFLFDVR